MKNVANFLLFQAMWFAAVLGGAEGAMWWGPAAAAGFLAVHLAMVSGSAARLRELAFALTFTVAGSAVDTGLRAAGLIAYPTSQDAWPWASVPPWIVSLWLGFALLPRFSLNWLRSRIWLAAVLGAVGGPLSFAAGSRFGVIATGDEPVLSYAALAAEYALFTPLMLLLSPRDRD